MNICDIVYRPIGIIHSEHVDEEKTPAQPVYAKGCRGSVEIYPEFSEGLRDLKEFSHIYLIYHFHKSSAVRILVKPFLHDKEHGIFSTRAPYRPNAIGLSIVELFGIAGNVLHFDGADIIDGTPLLDIKPCTVKFDLPNITRNGWQDEIDEQTALKKGKRGYRS